jgi:hypothetical protein
MTSTAGDSQLDEIISLVDSLTFYPDMAFGDKGKVPAFPELVIGDTNNESLNAGILYYCPVAYRRRFIFIEVIVLPEYRKEKRAKRMSDRAAARKGINTESGDILFPSLTGHIDAVISPAWRSYLVFLLQMYKGRDIIDHAAAIHQYLMYAGFKIDDLCSITGYNVFVSYYPELVKYWSESRDRKTTESGADTVTDFLDSVMGSELVIGMRNFLLTLAGIRFFGKEFDSTVFRVFGHQTRMSVTEFLSHLLTCLRSFLRFGQSLADGIPFTEALFAPDPVQAACEKVQYYIRRSDAVYTGLPTPGEIDLHTYMSELDKHLLFLEKSGKGMSPLSPVKKRLKCLLDEGRMVYNSKLADLYGRTRDTPLYDHIISV